VGGTPNICAGPFGALYDFYIERPWLMQAIGRTVWGIDASVLYDSMKPLADRRRQHGVGRAMRWWRGVPCPARRA
jgi:hypothetical protein